MRREEERRKERVKKGVALERNFINGTGIRLTRFDPLERSFYLLLLLRIGLRRFQFVAPSAKLLLITAN